MSKTAKKLQKLAMIKQRSSAIKEIATKYGWAFSGGDENTYKFCFVDKLGIYRLDIYLSTFTVGLLPIETGQDMKWFKRISYEKIEDIFKNPTKYEL